MPLRSGSVLVADVSLKTVKAGATSPLALLRILRRGVRIFSAQNLHAKVYAFDNVAFVGSANVSHSSSKHLIEAVVQLDDPALVADVRAFVLDLAITELDEADLIELQKHYVPPPKIIFPKQQAPFTTLVMELTHEQGGNRAKQVQPPKPVWEAYFGVAIDQATYPQLTLTNTGVHPPQVAPGTISKHDHNLTIEIPGAELPRPALLELRKVGTNAFTYTVHRPGGHRYSYFSKLLKTVGNPLWTSGRRWLII